MFYPPKFFIVNRVEGGFIVREMHYGQEVFQQHQSVFQTEAEVGAHITKVMATQRPN